MLSENSIRRTKYYQKNQSISISPQFVCLFRQVRQTIFYQKTITRTDEIYTTFYINYDAGKCGEYDNIFGKNVESLK